jgi:putative membrane protein
MFFVFLPLHLYGATHVYAQNPLGEWLQATFHTSRNPYDRLVHFSFGFLLAYPMRDVCLNYIKCSATLSWILPVVFSLAFGAFYEIVEWILAAGFFSEQSSDFLGLQGDQWDAQKDMILAFIGAFCGVSLVSICKKIASFKRKIPRHSAESYMPSR